MAGITLSCRNEVSFVASQNQVMYRFELSSGAKSLAVYIRMTAAHGSINFGSFDPASVVASLRCSKFLHVASRRLTKEPAVFAVELSCQQCRHRADLSTRRPPSLRVGRHGRHQHQGRFIWHCCRAAHLPQTGFRAFREHCIHSRTQNFTEPSGVFRHKVPPPPAAKD